MGFFQFFAATAAAMKYKWPMRQPKVYKEGFELHQIDEETFAVSGLNKKGLREDQVQLTGYLKTRLRRYTPVDTGRMRNSYLVFAQKVGPTKSVITIGNKAWYFRFPYHYYRGEMKKYKKFKFDFVELGVDDFVKKVGKFLPTDLEPGVAKPPTTKPTPTRPPTAEETKIREEDARAESPKKKKKPSLIDRIKGLFK